MPLKVGGPPPAPPISPPLVYAIINVMMASLTSLILALVAYSNPAFVQVYSNIVENPYKETGGDENTALTGVINWNFPRIRNWIWNHLTAVKVKVR